MLGRNYCGAVTQRALVRAKLDAIPRDSYTYGTVLVQVSIKAKFAVRNLSCVATKFEAILSSDI